MPRLDFQPAFLFASLRRSTKEEQLAQALENEVEHEVVRLSSLDLEEKSVVPSGADVGATTQRQDAGVGLRDSEMGATRTEDRYEAVA